MTTPALRLLGLGADADERAIKRAYAARLKTTRPDEDPEGFQRLNEAYREALASLGSRHAADQAEDAGTRVEDDHAPDVDRTEIAPFDDDDVATGARVAEAAMVALLFPAETSPVDVASLFHALLDTAANGSSDSLDAWLHEQSAFWPITDKTALGRRLVTLLHDEQPPVPDSGFACLVKFFAWDDLNSGQDALMLDQLALVLHEAWKVARESAGDFAIVIPTASTGWPCYGAEATAQARASNAAKHRAQADRDLIRIWHPDLLGQRSWLKWLVCVLLPARATAVRDVLASAAMAGTLTTFDPRAVRFWQGTGDLSTFTRGSAAIVFARSFAIGLAFGLCLLTAAGGIQGGQATRDTLIAGPIIAMTIAILASCGWLVMVLMVDFVRWQEQADPPPGWPRRLHRMAIPALVALSAGFMASPWPDGLALPVLLGTTITAWCRWTSRKPQSLPFDDRSGKGVRLVRHVILAVLFVLLLGRVVTSADALTWSCIGLMLAAGVFWTIDALRRGHRIPEGPSTP